jgi:hypothetical protein
VPRSDHQSVALPLWLFLLRWRVQLLAMPCRLLQFSQCELRVPRMPHKSLLRGWQRRAHALCGRALLPRKQQSLSSLHGRLHVLFAQWFSHPVPQWDYQLGGVRHLLTL